MVVKTRSDIVYFICVAVVLILAISLRTASFLSNVYNIHGDECHSLFGSIIPLKDVFSYYLQGANFLPVYKLIMKTIHHLFGFNWFLIKLPSYIFSVISVPLFYFVVRKMFKSRLVILCSLFLFAVNYTLLHFTMFAKPYMMEVCLNLLLLIMFLDIEDKIKTDKLKNCLFSFIIWTIFSIVCIFSSIPLLVIVAIYWVFLFIQTLIHKNKSDIVKISVALMLFFSCFLVQYSLLLYKFRDDIDLNAQWFCSDYYAIPNSIEAINSLIHFVFFEFQYFDSQITNMLHPVFLILSVFLFLVGCFLLILNKKIRGLSIVLPFIFFIVLSFFHIFPFNNRCITFLIPFFIIVFFYVFDCFVQKYRIYGTILLIVFFSLFTYQISYNYEKFIELFTADKFNYQLINTIANADPKYTAIISVEPVCSYCLDSSNVIYLKTFIHPDNSIERYFSYKLKHYSTEFDNNLITDKKKVYLLDVDTHNSALSLHIQKKIIEDGYVEIYRTPYKTFLNYILYEKI